MMIQRLFQTVVISTLVAFAVPAVASSTALPLCGEEKAGKDHKDASKKGDDKDQSAEAEKKDDKKNAKKADRDAPTS
jgi:hypothetical protein